MFWNILKNDIVRGMFKRKYLYIIATIVIVVLVIVADLSLRRKIGTQGYCGSVSAGDLLQVFYRGSRISDWIISWSITCQNNICLWCWVSHLLWGAIVLRT